MSFYLTLVIVMLEIYGHIVWFLQRQQILKSTIPNYSNRQMSIMMTPILYTIYANDKTTIVTSGYYHPIYGNRMLPHTKLDNGTDLEIATLDDFTDLCCQLDLSIGTPYKLPLTICIQEVKPAKYVYPSMYKLGAIGVITYVLISQKLKM